MINCGRSVHALGFPVPVAPRRDRIAGGDL